LTITLENAANAFRIGMVAAVEQAQLSCAGDTAEVTFYNPFAGASCLIEWGNAKPGRRTQLEKVAIGHNAFSIPIGSLSLK